MMCFDRLASNVIKYICIILCIGFSAESGAQGLPGPADAGRINPLQKPELPDHSRDDKAVVSPLGAASSAPAGAEKIHFILRSVRIEGMTAFSQKEMEDIYAPYIGKDVTLDIAWKFMDRVTKRYRDAGYFLSRAYVPEQRTKEGHIVIRVVEGVVGKVEIPADVRAYSVVQGYIDRLLATQPVRTYDIESFLLRMNDLPGLMFRAVLSPMDGKKAGDQTMVKLTLVPSKKEDVGSVIFDNYSSRYMDPNELSASYSTSLVPLQQTTVSGLSNLGFDKLQYGTLTHAMVIAPDVTLEVSGGVTQSYPGYTLESSDINSKAYSESVSLNYQWIRQREENLALRFTLDNRDVISDTAGTPLTRDHIHAARIGTVYDRSDNWQGYNIFAATVSQGIDGFGSSQKGDANLSRAGAAPDFTKAELNLSRLQDITEDWAVLAAAAGQWSSGVLYSSEQFGYGGQSFGRAYDASDITGDKGISGSLELRYNGYAQEEPVSFQPYAFYDIGEVWNQAIGQPKNESGSSVGFGLRFTTAWRESGNLGIAWPLIRNIAAPIYGSSPDGPRVLLKIGQEF